MIFKTFQSDLDGISNKIGFSKRSFAEWGKQVSTSFKESEGVVNSFKNALKTAFTIPIEKDNGWIKNKLGDIINKETIDSYIPQFTSEKASNLAQEIREQSIALADAKEGWEEYFTILKGRNQGYIVDLIKNTDDLSKLTSEDLVKANQQARASALAHNEAIKAQTLSAKAGKAALQALATVGNMLLMWGITKGLEAAVKGIDTLIHSSEHCKERVNELMSSYNSAIFEANSNAKTVEDLASKYEELSKGVNSLGENVSLTTDEYAEYNSICNQIADMFPNLIQGYTDEGNVLLSLKGNVEGLRDAYKEAQQEAYNMLIVSGKDSNGNDIIKNFQDTMYNDGFFKWESSAKEYVDMITELYNAMLSSDKEYKELYKDMTSTYSSYNNSRTIAQIWDIKKVLKEIGFTSDLSEEDKRNIVNNARSYIQTYQTEVDSALKNVQTLANAYLMTNEDYALLDEQSKNVASILVNSINENIASGFTKLEDVGAYVAEIINTIQDNPEVRESLVALFTTDLSALSPRQAKELVDQCIECIADVLGEDEHELKIRLGFEDVDTIAKNYNEVTQKAAEKFSGVILYHGTVNKHNKITQEEAERLRQEKIALEAFAKANSINTQDEIAFWNQCLKESETKEEAMEKYLASKFTGNGKKSIIPDISSSVSTIATQLEPQFKELGEAYKAIFTEEGFTLDVIDNSMLEGLRKSFAEIGEEIGVAFDPAQLEPFFAVLTNGGSEQEVQQAFNDLATAYLYSTDSLEQLNDETAKAIQKQLEQMGVANAEAVVTEALTLKNEELALSKKYLAENGKELTEATAGETLAFMAEQAEAGNCSSALAALQLQKLLVNGTLLDTETDISNVMVLAQSAGIATEALSELIILKAAYEKAETEGYTNTTAFSMVADRIKTLQQDFQDNVNNFKINPVDIEYKAPDSSKSSSSSSTSKQAETDWKALLDKETGLLEKQLAANLITFKEYTDKRRQIIEDYYRDGRIKAEEYYDALESMYANRLSLHDRAVNTVTRRLDEEIDRLKEQKEAIENSYQVRIDAIQEEIDALNKANDARREQIDLEKARYEAARAENQRVNRIYNGEQFIYEADMENVRDAEDDLADKEIRLNISCLETQVESLKAEMENATKSLDIQVEALESYKGKWNEISDVYGKQQDKLIAAEIMGFEWERDVLNGRLDTLRSFTEQYIALQQAQADAAVNAAKIKAEAGNGNTSGGNVRDENTSYKDKPEPKSKYKVIYEGTAKTVKIFNTPKEAQSYADSMNKGTADDDFMYYVREFEEYASGTDHARKGLNLVGEEGTEAFIDNDGNVSLVTKPTLIPMEGGEVVKNAEETKELLSGSNMDSGLSESVKALYEHAIHFDLTKLDLTKVPLRLAFDTDIPDFHYTSAISNIAPPQTGNVVHIDSISINCPNVTNNSGAEYIMRELKRLPLDTIQHMHRRN